LELQVLCAPTNRTRRYEAANTAYENLTGAKTTFYPVALERQIKVLGDCGHTDMARSIAGQIIKQLRERHEIDLT